MVETPISRISHFLEKYEYLIFRLIAIMGLSASIMGLSASLVKNLTSSVR